MSGHQRSTLLGALASAGLALGTLRRFDHSNPFMLLVRLHCRSSGEPRVMDLCVPDCAVTDGVLLPPVFARLVHLFNALGPYLARAEREYQIILDISDHGSADGISMDRPVGSDAPLIPDLYAMEQGLQPLSPRSRDTFAEDFAARNAKLFWRGSTTGSPIHSVEALELNPRVKFCRYSAEHLPENSDCKVSGLTQIGEHLHETAAAQLRDWGIFGEPVPEAYFARWQFFPDLDGNTSSWGSIRKFVMGMAVLRPSSSRETCFARQQIPWRTYAPIAADMTALAGTMDRLLNDDELSLDLAWNGYIAAGKFLEAIPGTLAQVFDSSAAQALLPGFEAWSGPELTL